MIDKNTFGCKLIPLGLILLLVFCSISCQKREAAHLSPREILDGGTLVAREIGLAHPTLLPTKMLVVSDKVVVFDNSRKTGIFDVYSIPDFTFLYSFGKIGEGPGEFRFVDPNSLGVLDDRIYIFTGGRAFITRLDSIRATSENVLDLQESVPVNRLLMLNDSTYVRDIMEAEHGGPEHILVKSGINKTLIRFGEYPEKKDLNPPLDQEEIYRSFLKSTVSNKQDARLAAFYTNHDRIKFYDRTGALQKDVIGENPLVDRVDQDSEIYRVEPFATDEFIYVLYIGKSKKEVENEIETFRPQLEVWNWDGYLVKRFTLDEPITTFSISENHQKLYGISFFRENTIFEFDLTQPGQVDRSVKKMPGDSDGVAEGANYGNNPVIENDYFRIELPPGFGFFDNIPENEKNFFMEKNGLYLTGGIFGNRKPEEKTFCGVTMQILIGIPKEASFDFETHSKSIIDRFISQIGPSQLKIDTLESPESNCYKINFTDKSIDPNGHEHLTYHEINIIERNGKIIETRFSGCELFDRYYEEVQKAFQTIETKEGFPPKKK